MFDQLSSTLILCDLLFNNGKYVELLEVCGKNIEKNKEKAAQNSRFQNVMMIAACYKLVMNDFHYFFD